jgi:hypothetical protein
MLCILKSECYYSNNLSIKTLGKHEFKRKDNF